MKTLSKHFGLIVILCLLMALTQAADDYDTRVVETATYESFNKIVGLNKPDDNAQVMSAENVKIANGVIFSQGKGERSGSQFQPTQQLSNQGIAPLLASTTTNPIPQQQNGIITKVDGSNNSAPRLNNASPQPNQLQKTSQAPKFKPNRVLGSHQDLQNENFDAKVTDPSPEDNLSMHLSSKLEDMSTGKKILTADVETNSKSAKEKLGLNNVINAIVKPKQERQSERRLLDLLMHINPHINGLSSKRSSSLDEFGLII